MLGRLAASQMACASAKSFLLPCTKGFTNWGEISFASCPMAVSRRAIQWAPAQASITTRQTGILANCVSIWLRESFLRKIILPMQMEAMLAKVNAYQGNAVHGDGLQKEKSPLSLPLAGIGLTISLSPLFRRAK